MPIQRRDADLGATIRNIANEFATARPDRKVNLSLSGDARGYWDDRRVGQAVANLVTNALRYSSDGTPVDISITAESEVAIAVHNEGPAIPRDRRPALFEPFRSAEDDGARRPDHRRPRLGLYIAKAIVEGHQGHIDVDSTAEGGTTFTIHLPRQATT
jgi:signal transduction histidine kinase